MIISSRVGRGLGAVFLAVAVAGCSDDAPTSPEPSPPITAVSILPETTLLTAIGDTVRFTATAHGATGDTLPASFTWTSTDHDVAIVDSTGLATTVGLGQAAVVAAAAGCADTAAVTVALAPRRVLWDAPVNGIWHDPARWRGGMVPAAGDTAVIAGAGSFFVACFDEVAVARLEIGGAGGSPRLHASAARLDIGSCSMAGGEFYSGTACEIGTLDLLGGELRAGDGCAIGSLVMTGGALRVEAPCDVTGSMDFRGGSIVGPGLLGVESLTLDGEALVLDAELEATGNMRWRCGSLLGAGRLETALAAEAVVENGTPVPLLGVVLTSGGDLVLDGEVVLEVVGEGFLDASAVELRGDASILPADGARIGARSIVKSAGDGISVVGTLAEGAGRPAVRVDRGELHLYRSGLEGIVTIASGAHLRLFGEGRIQTNTEFRDHGMLHVHGQIGFGNMFPGNLTVRNVTLHSGRLSGYASTTVTGSLVWLDGYLSGQGTLVIEEEAVFRMVGGDDLHLPLSYLDVVVRGELRMEPGIDLEMAYTDLVVASTGRWELGRGCRVRAAIQTPSLAVEGVLSMSGAETTLIEPPLICSGELVLEDGVLSVTDSFELTASGLIRGGRRDGQPGGSTRLDLSQAGVCVLAGAIEAGVAGEPAWLGIDGIVAMRPTTVVRIDLAESGGLRGERLVLPGVGAMAGTLVINRGLDPQPGEVFTVVATGMGTGAFGEVLGADGFAVIQDQAGVRLVWSRQD